MGIYDNPRRKRRSPRALIGIVIVLVVLIAIFLLSGFAHTSANRHQHISQLAKNAIEGANAVSPS